MMRFVPPDAALVKRWRRRDKLGAGDGEERGMAEMTGGEAIVAALRRHGIGTVFGLPGAQLYGLFDALSRAQPALAFVGARHEQACAYMALGAARATGRPAAFAVVPGPGMLNAAAGLVTALGCNAPVLCLTGQVPTAFLGKGRGHLHELPDQLLTLRSITKWAERIEHPAAAPALVAQAFQAMVSGRPGPAALEMPWDQFTARAEVAPCDPLPPRAAPPPDPDRIARVAALAKAAAAPMIMVGGGAFEAAPDIVELARLLEAPVVSFRSGRGILSDADPLGLTIAAAYRLWPETDLLIGIGTRLEVPGWRWPPHPRPPAIARIDIDPAEMRRFPVTQFVLADAAQGTRALVAALRRLGARGSGRLAAIAAAKDAASRAIRETVQPQMAYLDVIREVLPSDGFVVDELSQVGFASWYGFPVWRPRTYVSSGYPGTLGSGYPMALGVKVAHPDRPVVSIAGDGGFLFAVQELATAVQYAIGVVVIVFNNHGFANVRRDQMTNFSGRLLGADLVNPDFVRLAEAFGVAAARAPSPPLLRTALERALTAGGPWLIEVPLAPDEEKSPWPFIHPPEFA
jgi:acetolactate synthase I/II/III large subunit